MGYIGFQGYDERVNHYIKILEDKWGKIPKVMFFISFLEELKKVEDFSYSLAEKARNLDVNRASPFFQALKIFVLEDFEDIEDLEVEFCESSSRYKDNSELKFIRKIYNSL